MNPLIATFICAVGVAGLFYLDRDKTVRTSRALWLPVIWIGIVGSRSLSEWLGRSPSGMSQRDGSPLDAALFGVLLATAIIVLIGRWQRTRSLLAPNWPILLYFLYCLVSVSWSYDPEISFKRWIKALGDLAMVMIVVTDRKPLVALQRLIARLGFLLLPASVLFIKYYPLLGRGYTPDGAPMNTGVSTNKNMLGIIILVISLYTLWHVRAIWRTKDLPNRRRHLIAQGTLLAFCITLFYMAHSATAQACFALGACLILAANLRIFRQRAAGIHALILVMILLGGIAFILGGADAVAHALGRSSNLSGRKEIWAALIPAAPNALVGAGFEDFWMSPNVQAFQSKMVGWWHPEELNEAHNGYLEVYLNLGWIGVLLVANILIIGYKRAAKVYRRDRQLGGLFLAYVMVSAIYSFTEAGFRMMDPMWVFLLLAVVGSSGFSVGLFNSNVRQKPVPLKPQESKSPVRDEPRRPAWASTFSARRGSA